MEKIKGNKAKIQFISFSKHSFDKILTDVYKFCTFLLNSDSKTRKMPGQNSSNWRCWKSKAKSGY